MKVKRFLCLLFIVLLLILIPANSFAVEAPTTLKVYVQYFGMPETATLVGEFTRTELDELSVDPTYGYEGCYCNVTRVNTILRIHARGVRLAEFLRDFCYIDLNSVRQIDFHTCDISAEERFVSKGRYELLDNPRYYFPHLLEASHIDYDLNARVIDDGALAISEKVKVPTIIACEQGATKGPDGATEDLEMTIDSSFRLCVGQPDPITKTSFESAKWVDAIYVCLAGSPEDNPEGEYTGGQTTDDPTTDDPTDNPGDEPGDEPGDTPSGGEDPSDEPSGGDEPGGEEPIDNPGEIQEDPKSEDEPSQKTDPSEKSDTEETSGGKGYSELNINDYNNYIGWKESSKDDVKTLEVPEVTKEGAMIALSYAGACLAVGVIISIIRFRKEK